MRQSNRLTRMWRALLLLSICCGGAAAQTLAIAQAVAAMQKGDFASAERILRAEVQERPDDVWARSLLGVALDNEEKAAEADEFHRRAVAGAPHNPDVLNNYGTHLWGAGKYEQAEAVFTTALAAAPSYFKVLYNLGTMATFTGHYDRAREALEAALRQQPQNVDVLYRLACADEASRRWESAVARLAQAAKLDPRRADVQKLLALTTTELGALDDAAAAWEHYLKLQPNDDAARRERGYTAVKMGKFEQGTTDIEWFVARHPDDAIGHYELGQALRSVDMTRALAEFAKAITLEPKYAPARSARGALYNQQGKPELAVDDLEAAVSLQPEDAENLDRLGQTYQALDRPADAVRVLRRAAQLAPEDSKMLLHFGRALADAGETEESQAVMNRFRALGPERKKGVPAGLVEYLTLPPEERRAEYRARVEKAVHDHPEDAAAQLEYLKVLTEDGKTERLAAVAKQLAGLKPGGSVLADAGHALLETEHYALARDVLRDAGADLYLAIATYRAGDAKAGLAVLDRVGEAERRGDFYLARAEMLDAAGESEDAMAALDRGLAVAAQRPDFWLRATAFLVRKGNASEALRRIMEAARVFPDNREILLMRATTLEFARQSDEATLLLNDVRERWPEWPAAWAAQGILLNSHQQFEEARSMLETAAALGTARSEVYYYLADCELRAGHKDAAETAIRRAAKIAPGDPWIAALDAKIRQQPGSPTKDMPPYPGRVFQGSLIDLKVYDQNR